MQTELVVIVFIILFDLQEYVNIPKFLFSLLGAGKAGKWWQVWERLAHAPDLWRSNVGIGATAKFKFSFH